MSSSTLTHVLERPPVTSVVVPDCPTVSVVVPCYNEERSIGKTLQNLVTQYPAPAYEIIVVDGMSEDRTREVIREFQMDHPHVSIKLVENAERNIPKALNLGIATASGEIIARMDAHAAPSPGYIRQCVKLLESEAAEIVGMPCVVQPGSSSIMARAVAIAVSHPFGIGDATYRLLTGRAMQEQVDTVAFACFRKSLWSALHGYDESLLTNEDYDFNYRARLHGGRVLLDRSEHCVYFARPSLAALIRQYLRYGSWKARMIRRHPRSMRLRHLVAPAFVTSLVLLAAAGFWRNLGWKVLAGQVVLYFVVASAFAFTTSYRRNAGIRAAFLMPIVFLAIHVSWGASFLWGLVQQPSRESNI